MAGVAGRLRNGQAQGRDIFDLECFGVVRLRGDRDYLVVFVEEEELELVGQVFEGGARALYELAVDAGELEAFGLTLVGDLHGFFGLHFSFSFFWLI